MINGHFKICGQLRFPVFKNCFGLKRRHASSNWTYVYTPRSLLKEHPTPSIGSSSLNLSYFSYINYPLVKVFITMENHHFSVR